MRSCGFVLVAVLALRAFPAWAQQGQPDEFSLPTFTPPTPEQPTPPQPAEPTPPPSAPLSPLPVSRPPPAAEWARLGVSASLLVTALTTYFVGGDLALLVNVLGIPVSSDTVPGEVEGWVLLVGAEGGYGRAGGANCEGALFCASRASGGLLVKGGWARGLPHVGDSITRLQTMYFAQLEVLLAHYNIPSAPLSPGVKTFELLTRLRVGFHFTGDSSRVTSTGITLMAAAVVEVIPVSNGTQGVALGASVGGGF
ncbi:MAG: hypothetical protein JNM17_05855 [Archangium sp.]|nr:hypothetical protein [Archangium sp.]